MTLFIEQRAVVLPGDKIAQDMGYLPGTGTYREEEFIYAKRLGIVNIAGRAISLVPLSGVYLPKVGDTVICEVKDITMSGWIVGLNCPYSAMLNVKDATTRFVKKYTDLSAIFAIGDYLRAAIINVTSQKLVDISLVTEQNLGKLEGGRIFTVNPQKVPRIIGKSGSMISLIKNATECEIGIGQNGMVWIRGSNPEQEHKAEQAVRLVEQEAHLQGLTDRMSKFLGGASQ